MVRTYKLSNRTQTIITELVAILLIFNGAYFAPKDINLSLNIKIVDKIIKIGTRILNTL